MVSVEENQSIHYLFKYLFFIIIQFASILMMLTNNLEILGTAFTCISSIFISTVGMIDYSNYSLKHFDFISMFIYFSLSSVILSCAFMFKTITKLHYKHKEKGGGISLTRPAKEKFNQFKLLFIFIFISLPILFLISDVSYDLYFMLPKTFSIINYLLYSIKFLFPFSILTCCAFLIYITSSLLKMQPNQLYNQSEKSQNNTVKISYFTQFIQTISNLGFLRNKKTEII